MRKVSEFVSQNIGNTLTNMETWGGVIFNLLDYYKGRDGMDYTEAFYKAINAATAEGGGEVRVPPGQFLTEIIMQKTKVSLVGSGKDATVIMAAPSSNPYLLTIDSGPVQHVSIKNIQFRGNNYLNSGQGCMLFEGKADASHTTGGLWYSELENLHIDQFNSANIYFRGGATTSNFPNQFNSLRNVYSFRDNRSPSNTSSRSLKMTGQNGQFNIIGGQYDGGVYGQRNGTNIEISKEYQADGVTPVGGNSGYAISFINASSQSSDQGIIIDNAVDVSFTNSCYFEKTNRVFNVRKTAWQIKVEGSEFADCGNNSGNGYLFSVDGTSTLIIRDNYLGTPDQVFDDPDSNHQGVIAEGNFSAADLNWNGVVPRLFPTTSTLENKRKTAIWLDSSNTNTISQINHKLNPGEELTVRLNGDFTFTADVGNLDLGGVPSIKALDKDILTFIVLDIDGNNGLTLYLKGISRNAYNMQIKTITDTSTSVGAKFTKQINLLQPSATTITAFPNAYDGQELTLLGFNGNTTVQNSASLFLKGATNATIPNHGVLKLLFQSNAWYEVSRSF